MNKKIPSDYGFPNQPRKSKKRSKKCSSMHKTTYTTERDRDSYEPSEDEIPPVPEVEYAPMFLQQPQIPQAQHHSARNGRLFTAMSDPSVCGYSPVPVTYTMEPVSLPPMYHLYQPVVKPNYRVFRGRPRSAVMRMQSGPPCNSEIPGNGYLSLQENCWNRSTAATYQNGDYASLPPTANIDNKDNRQELNSEHRRYSDPGLGPPNLPINQKSEDSDGMDSNSSNTTVDKNNKLYYTLMQQMTKMRETNNQLFKELHQAKLDLETIKTEMQLIKQNVPCTYQPGMLTDLIKEIREASIKKEEAMFSKIKNLIESQHSDKFVQIEHLQSQLEQVRREKEEGEERIGKLEKEVAALRLGLNNSSCYSSSSSSEIREIAAFEEENLALRRELQEARTARVAGCLQPPFSSSSSSSGPMAIGNASTSEFASPTPSMTVTTTTINTTTMTISTTNVTPPPLLPSSSSSSSPPPLPTSTTTMTSKCVSVSSCTSADSLDLEDDTLVFEPDANIESIYASTPEPTLVIDTEHSSPTSSSVSSLSVIKLAIDDASSSGDGNNVINTGSSTTPSLCSSSTDELLPDGQLTSRVLTAPSRATYTTAYI